MKVNGKVLKSAENKVLLELEKKAPKTGTPIVLHYGKKRSLKANAFYWCYLNFVCKECDLWKDHAHCPESLHDSLKRHVLSKKTYDDGKFKIFLTGSTADLTQHEMYEYIQKIDMFVCDTFKVSTARFWSDYASMYSSY